MKAIIFDMDGVVIDSEPIHFEVEKEILEELGGVFNERQHEDLVGTTDYTMWSTFKEKFDLEMPIEEMLDLKKERFLNNLDKIPLVDGLGDFMACLYDQGYHLALASSNNRRAIDAIIEKFNLGKYLKFTISGEEVKNGKPDPEIFLRAAKRIKIDPAECLVIEDAENGVRAAKAAGMKCIGFKNPNSGDQDLSKADLIIESYDELSLENMKKLFS